MGSKQCINITGYIARYAAFAVYLKHGRSPNSTGPLPGLSSPIFRSRAHQSKLLKDIEDKKYGAAGKTLAEMFSISFRECDAIIGVKTCKEMEGVYVGLVEKNLDKPVLLAGPVVGTTIFKA